jgi:hypothetical protein
LRRGGYGKNIFDPDQEFRAIDRLQKLIEQCGENFPTPMQIAYELYRTGWTDNGRKQLFNYLVNVGVISQDIYKAGLDLIATDGMALYDQGLIEPVEGDLEEFDEIDENPEVLPDCFGETEKFERPEDEAEQQGFVDAPVGTAVLQRH